MEKRRPLIIIIFIGIFYWPLAVAWSIAWGVIGGFVFKYIACWEEVYTWCKQEYREWKRYPKKCYERYIKKKEDLETERIRGKGYGAFLMIKSKEDLEKEFPTAPFPLFSILTNILLFGLATPLIRVWAGAIEGPMILIKDAFEWWNVKILRKPDLSQYRKLIEIEKKITSGEYKYEDYKQSYSEA